MKFARLLLRLALGSRLPITSGTLKVEGLDDEIVVRRDRYGIPHITGASDSDVWFGLGFCHAQDRAFQLESIKRVAHGTLSEVIGPEGLAVDRIARRLGFLRYARRQLGVLDQDVLEVMSAYAAGVTGGLSLGGKRRAHEFALLRMRPSGWEPVDVLAVAKLLSFAMSGNWDAELARFRVLVEDGPDALAQIDPEYAAWHPVVSPPGGVAGEQLDRLSGDLAALTGALGMSGGSNAWAVAPAKSATGRPIVANDPHLPPRLPSPWYLAHLDVHGDVPGDPHLGGSEWGIAGASFVGVPIFPTGHNGRVAWGTTLGLADTSDLYIEGPFDSGSSEVREVIREQIQVRGKPSVVEEVPITGLGPLLTPLIDGAGYAISIRAIWMQARPIHGFLRVGSVRDAEQFRAAFRAWPLMSLNLVFADDAGTIGWQLVGETPVRRSGHGIVPASARSGHGEWLDDPVPYADMPGAADPDAGYLVSANHRPVSEGAGPFLGVDWADGLRAARIGQRLSADREWDIAGTAGLQMDQFAVQWGEVHEAVLSIKPGNQASRDALALLAEWDGVMGDDSGAAAIFELLLAEIDRRDVAARAPRAGRFVLGADIGGLGQPNLLVFRRAGRLSRLLRQPPDKWQALLSESLQSVVEKLAALAGADSKNWGWGRLRPLTLEHPVGRKWPLGGIFNIGPVPFGGDTNTVAQAAVDPLDPLATPLVIPSLRCAMDVGDFDNSTFALPSGQSGDPLSAHYSDMFALWLRGEGVPIPSSADGVLQATVSTLTLAPAPGSR